MTVKPTSTINRIHFSDLDPLRFEDFCLCLVYKLARWRKINHLGRLGKDEGIDIEAEEEIKEGYIRSWYIQCKRYKTFKNSDVSSVIKKLQDYSKISDTLLLIVGCDVSAETIKYYEKEAIKIGFKNPKLWTASILEAELFNNHHDLLFVFFGIDMNQEEHKKEESIRRNLKLKKSLIRDITKKIDFSKSNWTCQDRFKDDNIIVHSIDDKNYPEIDERDYGISSWFRVEIYDFYYNGIEVILNLEYAEILNDKTLKIIPYSEYEDKFDNCIKLLRIGRIPFSMIVDYDPEGDEYYNETHFYCNYGINGQPYEKIIYREIIEEDYCHNYPEVEVIQ